MHFRKYRLILGVMIILIVPAGFLAKLCEGPLADWVNNSFSNILYVVFWCLIFSLLAPRLKSWLIALLVLLGTSLIEIAQLANFDWLEMLRQYFLGRVILGTTFIWTDFLYYLLGSILGGWLLYGLKRKTGFNGWKPHSIR